MKDFILTMYYHPLILHSIIRQTFGTPMGSPLSPIIADLVLQEEMILQKFNFNIQFYLRYVDDIILSAPINQIPHIVDSFNSYHTRLQFTAEQEKTEN